MAKLIVNNKTIGTFATIAKANRAAESYCEAAAEKHTALGSNNGHETLATLWLCAGQAFYSATRPTIETVKYTGSKFRGTTIETKE